MNSLSRLPRLLAGLCAAVALLSAAARPLVACEMRAAAGAVDEVAATTTTAAVPAVDPHAHHRASGASSAAIGEAGVDEIPTGPAAPNDEHLLACDHLINCTVLVATTAPAEMASSATLPDAAPRWDVARHDAPARAIDPPPPRD